MKVTSIRVSGDDSSSPVPKPEATSQTASRKVRCPACTPDPLYENGECEKLLSALQVCQDT